MATLMIDNFKVVTSDGIPPDVVVIISGERRPDETTIEQYVKRLIAEKRVVLMSLKDEARP